MELLDRHLRRTAADVAGTFPALMLLGARQVGKSTLCRQLDPAGAQYLTLDSRVTLAAARDNPVGFIESYADRPLVIDELQRCPELFLEIKASIDRDRRPGRFLLTGSADLLRLERTPDSLAGRAILLNLEGFSQGELEGTADDFVTMLQTAGPGSVPTTALRRLDYVERIMAGGFPEVRTLSPRARRLWFGSYLTQIVQRDARDAISTNQPERLETLLRVIAANQAGELVKAHLAANAELPASTATAHLDALQRLFLIYTLLPWTNNALKRVVGKPKAGLRDVGLAAHLLGASPERLGSLTSPHIGGLLESFVVTELMKQQGWSETAYRLHHYRDASGTEVDLIVELDDETLWAIEVKATETPRPDHLKNVGTLRERLGDRVRGGILLCLHPEVVQLREGLWTMPVASLWEHSSSPCSTSGC